MEYVIAKAVTTESRRLKIGDPVNAEEHLSPHTFDDLRARGFIAPKPTPATASAPSRLAPTSVKDED